MATKKITYGIGFQVDEKGLKKVQSELQKISAMSLKDFNLIDTKLTEKEINNIKSSAQELHNILKRNFNEKLGSYNLDGLNKDLKTHSGLLKEAYEDLNKLGASGRTTFRNMASDILSVNGNVRETTKLIDSLAKTLGNTIKWSISSGILNSFTRSLQSAWGFAKKLDEALTDIRIVTGKSTKDMENFAKAANRAAKNLGTSTTSYAKASLIYYQQGLSEKDVQARTQTTIKAANVTGQSAAEVSEQLTAVWNGYKVVAEEAELYVDKLAAVAATTAADLEELSTGMSKVASAANAMGVDVDQLSAQLATIVSVTRQDASVVGTALKTIYSRMGDLKVDGVDEFGTSLGDVSGQLKQMGINVLDQEGNLRDMGKVIEEVAAKWGTWTDAQQQAAAVAIAGKRQYNNLIALFENWDMYESSLSTSQNAEGTLQKQQEEFEKGLEYRLNKLAAAGDKLWKGLIDTDGTKNLIALITALVEAVGWLAEALNGFSGILTTVGPLLLQFFNKQVADGLRKTFHNAKTLVGVKDKVNREEVAKELKVDVNNPRDKKYLDDIVALREKELSFSKYVVQEEREKLALLREQRTELRNQEDLLLEKKKGLQSQQRHLRKKGKNITGIDYTKDPNGESKLKAALIEEQSQIDQLRKGEKNSFEGYEATSLLGQDDLQEVRSSGILDKGSHLKGVQSSTLSQKLSANEKKLTEDQVNATKSLIKVKEREEKVFNKVEKTLGKGSKEYKTLKTVQSDFYNGTITGTTYLDTQDQILKQVKVSQDQFGVEVDQTTQNLKENSLAIDENNRQLKKHKKEADAANNNKKPKTDKLGATMDAIGGALAVVGALQNAIGLFDSLADGSADAGDAIQGVIGILMSLIPVIVLLGTTTQLAFWQITLIMAGIVAAIAIISGAIALVKNHESEQEKFNKRIKESEERTNAARESYNKLSQSVRDLKNALKDLSEQEDAFKYLVKGTSEWQEKIDEVNASVMDLIEETPELAKFMTIKDGHMTIDTESQGFQEYQKNLDFITDMSFLNVAARKVEEATIKNTKESKENTEALKRATTVYNKAIANIYGIEEDEQVAAAFMTSTTTSYNDNLKDMGLSAFRTDWRSLGWSDKRIDGNRIGNNFNSNELTDFNTQLTTALSQRGLTLEKGVDTSKKVTREELKNLTVVVDGAEMTVEEALALHGNAKDYATNVHKNKPLLDAMLAAQKAGYGAGAGAFILEDKSGADIYNAWADTVTRSEMERLKTEGLKLDTNEDGTIDFEMSGNSIRVGQFTTAFEDAAAKAWEGNKADFNRVFNAAGTANFTTSQFASMAKYFDDGLGKYFSDDVLSSAEMTETVMKLLDNDAEAKAKYSEKYGVSNKFKANGIDLLNATIEKNKLELDYTKQIANEMERAFGTERLHSLQKMTESLKNMSTIATEDFFNRFNNTGLDKTQFVDKESGKIDYEKLLDYIAKLNALDTEDSDLYEEAVELLGAYDLMQEKAWAVTDAKIEEYKYQLDILETVKEMVKKSKEIQKSIKDWNKGIQYLGLEQSFINSFANLQSDFSDGTKNFSTYMSEIDNLSNEREAFKDIDYDRYKSTYTRWVWGDEDYLQEDRDNVAGQSNYVAGSMGESTTPTDDSGADATYTYQKWNAEKIKAFEKENDFVTWVNGQFNFNEGAFQELLKQDIDKASAELENLISIVNQLFALWEKGLKEIQETYDNVINTVSDLNSIISGGIDATKVMGGVGSPENLGVYYDLLINASEETYDLKKNKVNDLLQAYQEAVKKGNSQLIQSSKEALVEATNELTQYATDQFELISNKFKDLTSKAIDDALGEDRSFAQLSTAWELEKAKDEMFLDEVNAQYGIDNIVRNFEKSINETDSIYAQNKLMEKQAEIQKRLNDLRDAGQKITQYDLDLANAEYELTLKQIALEEAQQVANKMKLVRDASGNYTYQYVQDQDAIDTAEQELADAQNRLYNLEKDRKKELIDSYFSLMTEYQEKYAEAAAAGDEELMDQVYNHYFGSEGILNMLKRQLGVIEADAENLNELFDSAEYDFSGAILNFDATGLQTIAQETKTEIGSLKTTMDNLWGSDSPLVSAVTSIARSIGITKDVNSGEYQVPTGNKSWAETLNNTALLEELLGSKEKNKPGLITTLNGYMDTVTTLYDDLELAMEEYGSLFGDMTEIGENTTALTGLTAAAYELLDQLETGDDKGDGQYGDYKRETSDANNNGILDWISIKEN